MPKCVKKKLSKHFNICCAIHDLEYKNQDKTKDRIDDEFLDNMIDKSENIFQLSLAFIFYFFVRLFGIISWYRNKIRRFYKG